MSENLTYQEFFGYHPVGTNRKQVILDFKDGDQPQQLVVTFSWLCGQACYVHLTHAADRRELYVGTYDSFNHDLWPTPTSLTPTSYFFRHVRRFVKAFHAGRLKEFYDAKFVGGL